MPIPLIGQIFYDGLDSVPHISTILKAFPWLVLLWALKIFFNGSFNDDARIMHGKVVMVTVCGFK